MTKEQKQQQKELKRADKKQMNAEIEERRKIDEQEKKKQKLAPGEMETVKLTADMIGGITSGAISLSLEEVK
mgnify:CR=1 FL=1